MFAQVNLVQARLAKLVLVEVEPIDGVKVHANISCKKAYPNLEFYEAHTQKWASKGRRQFPTKWLVRNGRSRPLHDSGLCVHNSHTGLTNNESPFVLRDISYPMRH